jgi:hypothetical protein
MLPVCGNPGMGTAFATSVTVGAADAAAGRPKTARPRRARQVDALRIGFFSSVDGQVGLDPAAPESCRSGDIEISGN